MDIQETLAALERYDGIYKRDAVEAAIAHGEDIIPPLIDILERVAAAPQTFVEDHNYYAHIYAAMLLGHLQAATAHSAIVNVFSGPPALVEDLFGDLITENLAMLLVKTANGSLEEMQALAANPAAYVYCRGAALQAITYGVMEDYITREDALTWMASFLKAADPATVTNEEREFYDQVGYTMCDLCPLEEMDTIRWAFDNEVMLPSFMVELEDFEDAIASGSEACLTRLQERYQTRAWQHIHEAMEWWVCFQPKPSPPPTQKPLSAVGFGSSSSSKKKKKKKFWDL